MSITFESGSEKETYFDLDLAWHELALRTDRLTLTRVTGRAFGGMREMSFMLETRLGQRYTIKAVGASCVDLVCDLLDAR
ncbi:MAG TPA: hypothetical protein VMU11_03970 [Verrucomicrobiae bacterium]|nr:hypothetical protein [Verrucomicrobiae bacterium]